MRRLIARLVLLLVCFATSGALAQPAGDPASVLARVEAAYENLDYDEAEGLARNALSRFEVFSPDQLIRLHTTLALILFAKGEEVEAAEQFRGALTLNPDLQLDPLLVSPITLTFFEETRTAFIRERDSGTTPTTTVRYIQLEDTRPSATWRSAVLPGWGQRYKGNSTRGWALTGLWTATVAGTVVAHVQRNSAQDAYLAETDPTLVADRYDTYNQWHKLRSGLLMGAAAVWVFSTADALISGGADSNVQVAPGPNGLSLQYRF